MKKDFRKAEEHFQKIIDLHPFWPEELYEFGLVYAEWGKKEEALEYFKRARDIWADADSIYKPARQNREKIAELEALFID
jgi:tetratricopeptide (TPR) repeat protein